MQNMVAAGEDFIESLLTIQRLKKASWAAKVRERIDHLIEQLPPTPPYELALLLYARSLQVGHHVQKDKSESRMLLRTVQRELVLASDRARNASVWFGGLVRRDLDRDLALRAKADLVVDALAQKIDERTGQRIEVALDRLGDRLERRLGDGTERRNRRTSGQSQRGLSSTRGKSKKSARGVSEPVTRNATGDPTEWRPAP